MRKAALLALGIVLGSALTTLAAPRAGKAPARKHIVTPGRATPPPLSDAVLVGDTLYLSGKLGLDPATGKPPESVEDEVKLALDGLKKVLGEAKMTMDDLVQVQVFCTDISLYEKFNAVYRSYFAREFPARAFLGSGPLVRGARFEVQGIAVRR